MHIHFTAQIRKKDFIRLFFSLTLRKPAIIVSIILGLALFIFSGLSYLHIFSSSLAKNPLFMLFMGFTSVIYLLFGIYRSAVKNYNLHDRLNQELTYDLTDDKISYTGAAFTNEFQWSSFYKIVSIRRDWIILYNTKTVANFLPVSGLRKEELAELKSFFRSNKAVWSSKIKV